jgi:hypothetical protein
MQFSIEQVFVLLLVCLEPVGAFACLIAGVIFVVKNRRKRNAWFWAGAALFSIFVLTLPLTVAYTPYLFITLMVLAGVHVNITP